MKPQGRVLKSSQGLDYQRRVFYCAVLAWSRSHQDSILTNLLKYPKWCMSCHRGWTWPEWSAEIISSLHKHKSDILTHCFGQHEQQGSVFSGLPQSLAKNKPLSKQVGCSLCCPAESKVCDFSSWACEKGVHNSWNSMAVVPAGLGCNCVQKPYKNKVTAAGSFCVAALS